MSRTRRDKAAERAAIAAAADRLLVGTPLRSASGKLTATELIAESALRRDVVYEHTDLVVVSRDVGYAGVRCRRR
jgi:hypothetical protein